MCRTASPLLLQKLKGSMSGDAQDFNNIDMRAVIKIFFFLQSKVLKEIHAILVETLGEHAPSYASVKNWMALFKRGDFSTRQIFSILVHSAASSNPNQRTSLPVYSPSLHPAEYQFINVFPHYTASAKPTTAPGRYATL